MSTWLKRVATLFILLMLFGVCLAGPSFQVTLGSKFAISANDAGLEIFNKKPKVFVRVNKKIITIPAKLNSDKKTLTCTWKKSVASGLFSLWLEQKDDSGNKQTIKISDFFAVMPPKIYKVSSSTAGAGDELTVDGAYFSSKCSFYMGSDSNSMSKCKIITGRKDIMDSETGTSSATIKVPNGIDSVDGVLLKIDNPISSDLETIDSDLASNEATSFVLSVGDVHETSKYLAKVSSFINSFKTEHENMTVAINAGDLLSAYNRKSYDPEWARDLYTDDANHGVTIMELTSKIAFDVVTIGNHDPCLGYERFNELLNSYPIPMLSGNLFHYQNAQYTLWHEPSVSSSPSYMSFQLKGIDVGVVAVTSSIQNHWTNDDKHNYKIQYPLNEQTIKNIRHCALFNEIVILITHENDVSLIIPVYGTPTPTGYYYCQSDIYTLTDLKKVAVIVGGHEHKNYFRRASYSGDNDKYALYIDKVYNEDSKAVLIKSSKFFGEYVGVLKVLWNKSSRELSGIKLMEGSLGDDGNYLGCADNQMTEVDDDGVFQELDDSPWDPTVSTHWWRMDNWPNEDENIKSIIKRHRKGLNPAKKKLPNNTHRFSPAIKF